MSETLSAEHPRQFSQVPSTSSQPRLTKRRPPRSGLHHQFEFMRKTWRGPQNTGSSIFTATPILLHDRQRGPVLSADRQCLPNTANSRADTRKNSRMTTVPVQEREFSSAASPESLKFVSMQRGSPAELDCSAREWIASSRQFRS